MVQYGISSMEEFTKARELNIFKENFVHVSESDQSKFDYVKAILERSENAVFEYPETLPEYDVSEPINLTNTIFIIKKYGKEMVLITRPSGYEQVILYYGAEKDILDPITSSGVAKMNGILKELLSACVKLQVNSIYGESTSKTHGGAARAF